MLYRVAVARQRRHDARETQERLHSRLLAAPAARIFTHGRSVVFVGYTVSRLRSVHPPLPQPALPPPDSTARHGAGVRAGGRHAMTPSPIQTNPDAQAAAAPGVRIARGILCSPRAWLPLLDTSNDEIRLGASTERHDSPGLSLMVGERVAVCRAGCLPSMPCVAGRASGFHAALTPTRDGDRRFIRAIEGRDNSPAACRRRTPAASGRRAQRAQCRCWRARCRHFRVREAQQIFAAYHLEHDRAESPAAAATLDRGAVRLGYSFTNAKRYGYSISRESGVRPASSPNWRDGTRRRRHVHARARTDIRGFVPLGLAPRHARPAWFGGRVRR